MHDGPRFSRRVVLKVASAAGLASLPLALEGCADDVETAPPGFFTAEERRALGAFCDAILPADASSPGASKLGAVAFIERLLTAFDVDPPALFADGPYSGRAPFFDGTVPPNDFTRFRPLDRVTERAWRLRLYGAAAPGGLLNEGLVPPHKGLRDLFKDGLRDVMGRVSAPIETLAPEDIAGLLSDLDPELQTALTGFVPQAAFGAPEYGGNAGLAGWRMIHFPGDTLPFGYSPFDEGKGQYHERNAEPMTRPDEAPDPTPLDDEIRSLLNVIVDATGGKVFR